MMHNLILKKHANLKRDWPKNNTIIVIKVKNNVLYEKLQFITTRWQRKITNGLIQLTQWFSNLSLSTPSPAHFV